MVAVFIECAPMGAVRQSSSDGWKQRPVVMRYRAYKDELRLNLNLLITPDLRAALVGSKNFDLVFKMPFPKTYNKKKRKLLAGTPHNEKPDIDNLIKAIFDTICEDDKHISRVSAEKIWQEENGESGVMICGY